MKNRLTNYFNIIFNVKNHNENLDDLKHIIFNEKTTAQSIALFLDFKRDFEEELSKRKTKAINENNYVDGYFRPRPKLNYTTVKDSIFNEKVK